MLVTVGSEQNEVQQCDHRNSYYARWKFTMVVVGVLNVRSTSVPDYSFVIPKKCQVLGTPTFYPCSGSQCRSQSRLGYNVLLQNSNNSNKISEA